MDPLSVTASIIAVLQVTTSILSICYAAKRATRELPYIVAEVTSLRDVLQAIEQLAQKADSGDQAATNHLPTLRALCQHDGPLQQCLSELQSLERRLAPNRYRPSIWKNVFVQGFRQMQQNNDTLKILERIRRLRGTLVLSLAVDNACVESR
jgi:hypothetical protein